MEDYRDAQTEGGVQRLWHTRDESFLCVFVVQCSFYESIASQQLLKSYYSFEQFLFSLSKKFLLLLDLSTRRWQTKLLNSRAKYLGTILQFKTVFTSVQNFQSQKIDDIV